MKLIVKKVLNKLGYKLVKIKSVEKPIKAFKPKLKSVLNGDANHPFDKVPFAGETLEYLVNNFNFETILDIGSGEGKHTDVLLSLGKRVTSIDFGNSVYFEKRSDQHNAIIADYYEYDFDYQFDSIWGSHVLEHQPNPNFFLKKIHRDLKEGGILALTVPPLKNEIVGGHVTLWNAGLLIYQLVLAGFNCKDVSIKSYGYNVSVVLHKKSINSYPELSYDKGDINRLKDYFPDGLVEPFDGRISNHNW